MDKHIINNKVFVSICTKRTINKKVFVSIYISLNAELPFYTRLFIAISLWFRGNFFLITGVTIISILSVWIMTLTDRGRLARDKIILNH